MALQPEVDLKALPVFVIAGIAAGYAVMPLRKELAAPVRQDALVAANETGGVSVVGQFRTSFSAWLWAKTDVYLHNGQEVRQLTEAEIKLGEHGVECDDHDHDHENEGKTTSVVPPPERDFRGWMGDVERAVKPYVDIHHHTHNDPKDTLPLFRLMTWMDAEFVPGWVNGAAMMARTDVDKAIAFLEEGLKSNPTSIPILSELGRLEAAQKKDYEKALGHLEAALMIPADPTKMGEFEADAYRDVFRWAALCQRQRRKITEMHQILEMGLRAFPNDGLMTRLEAGDAPLVLSPKARDEWMSNNPIRPH